MVAVYLDTGGVGRFGGGGGVGGQARERVLAGVEVHGRAVGDEPIAVVGLGLEGLRIGRIRGMEGVSQWRREG